MPRREYGYNLSNINKIHSAIYQNNTVYFLITTNNNQKVYTDEENIHPNTIHMSNLFNDFYTKEGCNSYNMYKVKLTRPQDFQTTASILNLGKEIGITQQSLRQLPRYGIFESLSRKLTSCGDCSKTMYRYNRISCIRYALKTCKEAKEQIELTKQKIINEKISLERNRETTNQQLQNWRNKAIKCNQDLLIYDQKIQSLQNGFVQLKRRLDAILIELNTTNSMKNEINAKQQHTNTIVNNLQSSLERIVNTQKDCNLVSSHAVMEHGHEWIENIQNKLKQRLTIALEKWKEWNCYEVVEFFRMYNDNIENNETNGFNRLISALQERNIKGSELKQINSFFLRSYLNENRITSMLNHIVDLKD
eukprot:431066_1